MGKQLKLNLYKGCHGGRRPYSGRKRIHSKGVAHRVREKVSSRTPLHVNFKFKTFIRNKSCLKILKRAILNARKQGLAVIHFSLQHNHIHLILEAHDNDTLTRGMRALTVTFAKGLHRGRIQIERYHLHILRTLKETKNAIRYVLLNEQKHSQSKVLKADSYSSLIFLGYDFVRTLIKREKLRLIWKPEGEHFLDRGRSWILFNCTHSLTHPS